MASITIDLSDSKFQQLQDLAAVHGITIEALLRMSMEDWINAQQREFVNAADYVLMKNTELYQRLA